MNYIKKLFGSIYFRIILLLIPYALIYFLVGALRTPVYEVHSVVDDMIPFNEWFVFPYISWFLYVAALIIYLFHKDHRSFMHFSFMFFVGIYACDIFFIFFPNYITFRPEVTGNSIASFITKIIFALDKGTNVFPSIHVLVSWVVFYAVMKTASFNKKYLIKIGSFTLTCAISLATMFLKQHSFWDVLAGFIFAFVLFILAYYTPISKKLDAFYERHG